MDNRDAYARGLLKTALDPSTQPPAIRSFLEEERVLVRRLLPRGARVLDFGCGWGRHLVELGDHVGRSIGFDYDRASIAEAVRSDPPRDSLHFLVADATAVPLACPFDAAVCLTNTWGTMSDPVAVLAEMRRLSPAPGSRLVTVWAATSVPARSRWYANMGYRVLEVTDREIQADRGFTSGHFTEERLRASLGPCEIHRVGEVAYLAEC